MATYADTSALVKLVVPERESNALSAWIAAERPALVSSDLTRTELLRAVRRLGSVDLVGRARSVLDFVILLSVGTSIFETAGRLDPAVMRSLDALHIACALELGDDLDTLLTYDERMADAARSYGIRVLNPS